MVRRKSRRCSRVRCGRRSRKLKSPRRRPSGSTRCCTYKKRKKSRRRSRRRSKRRSRRRSRRRSKRRSRRRSRRRSKRRSRRRSKRRRGSKRRKRRRSRRRSRKQKEKLCNSRSRYHTCKNRRLKNPVRTRGGGLRCCSKNANPWGYGAGDISLTHSGVDYPGAHLLTHTAGRVSRPVAVAPPKNVAWKTFMEKAKAARREKINKIRREKLTTNSKPAKKDWKAFMEKAKAARREKINKIRREKLTTNSKPAKKDWKAFMEKAKAARREKVNKIMRDRQLWLR